MDAILLLVWMWLMAGCLFCGACLGCNFYPGAKWYALILCWPVYLGAYVALYFKWFMPDVYYFIKYQTWRITHKI